MADVMQSIKASALTAVKYTNYVRYFTIWSELTEQFRKIIGDDSPVDPIEANWLVFKLEDNKKYPDCKYVKVFVQPDVPYAGWAIYAETNLDSEGNMQFYSQQDVVNDLLKKSK